ncbi:histamine H2 receptor [Nematostella vectensis]|uniref:histamine H2 receptor n=1 Tax=Nematostella vectensis TaxID=45351 RepID=UPI002077721C|nr:histamine H2 receptor [Nematostella vectensis]
MFGINEMSLNETCFDGLTNTSTVHRCSTTDTPPLSPLTIGLILEPAIVLVVLGNLLVLVSLRCQRNLIVTDVLLFSLSLADFVDGLIPLQIVIFMNYFVQQPWAKSLCDAFVIIVNTMRFASAGTVTIIALERTFLIVSPLKYHTTVTISKAKKLVALLWIISIFFGILPFLNVGHSGYHDGNCLYQLYDLGTEYAIVILAFSFLLLAVVLSCYVAAKLSSLKFIKRQSDMVEKLASDASKLALVMGVAKNDRTKRKISPKHLAKVPRSQGVIEVRKLTIMLAVVIILYYISWLPILVNNIVTLIRNEESPHSLVLFTGMISLLYALCNPFLYGKMNARYRRGYQHAVGSVLGLCGLRPASWRIRKISRTSFPSQAEFSLTKQRISTVTQPVMSALAQTTDIAGQVCFSGRRNAGYDEDKTSLQSNRSDLSEDKTSLQSNRSDLSEKDDGVFDTYL